MPILPKNLTAMILKQVPSSSQSPERMHDIELGAEKNTSNGDGTLMCFICFTRTNSFLTGKINDVGAVTRTNILISYRAGVEIMANAAFTPGITASGNLTLSSNKIKDFTEYYDDYDEGGQKSNFFSSPDIAFSPSVVADSI